MRAYFGPPYRQKNQDFEARARGHPILSVDMGRKATAQSAAKERESCFRVGRAGPTAPRDWRQELHGTALQINDINLGRVQRSPVQDPDPLLLLFVAYPTMGLFVLDPRYQTTLQFHCHCMPMAMAN